MFFEEIPVPFQYLIFIGCSMMFVYGNTTEPGALEWAFIGGAIGCRFARWMYQMDMESQRKFEEQESLRLLFGRDQTVNEDGDFQRLIDADILVNVNHEFEHYFCNEKNLWKRMEYYPCKLVLLIEGQLKVFNRTNIQYFNNEHYSVYYAEADFTDPRKQRQIRIFVKPMPWIEQRLQRRQKRSA